MDVCCGDSGVFGVELEGDEFAVGWECSCKPDGAVSAEGSDFEDSFGSLHSGEEMKELALGGLTSMDGKAGTCVRFECVIDGLIGGMRLLVM